MASRFPMPRLAILLIATSLGLPVPAVAQEVLLRGKQSQLNISGTLVSAEGGMFVVRTAIGEFEIERKLVTCEGSGCPKRRGPAFALDLASESSLARGLIPILAEGYAASLDAEAIATDAAGNPVDPAAAGPGEDGKSHIAFVDYDGQPVAHLGILEADGMEAVEALVAGRASLLFQNERATRKARAMVAEAGLGDLESPDQDRVMALEGYAVVVNPKNAVGAITIEQAGDILAGRITDWSELGGAPGPINVYSLAEGMGAFDSISEALLSGKAADQDAARIITLAPSSRIVADTEELTEAVANDEAGVGIVSYLSRRDTRPLPLTNECGMTFYVSPFTIKTEEYPLARRVHVYSLPQPEGQAQAFLDYLLGPEADELVQRAGLVGRDVQSEIQIDATDRLATAASAATDPYEKGLMQELIDKQGLHERLTTTFRFAPGSDALDQRGQYELARLIAYLKQRAPAEVVAVGFTDDRGLFDANLAVSEQRAGQVIRWIEAAAAEAGIEGIRFSAVGYGEISPVACNSSPRGRASNRRVEIWIR